MDIDHDWQVLGAVLLFEDVDCQAVFIFFRKVGRFEKLLAWASGSTQSSNL